jgi:hypothetical protein
MLRRERLARQWHARGQRFRPPGSTTPSRVRCARCVPAALTETEGWQRSCRSAGQCARERLVPLKAVAPVRIRSGLQPRTSTTRPLTCRNEGQGPCCVSDQVRPGPAVGGYLCPIRAPVVVRDGGLTAVRPCLSQLDGDPVAGDVLCSRVPSAASSSSTPSPSAGLATDRCGATRWCAMSFQPFARLSCFVRLAS